MDHDTTRDQPKTREDIHGEIPHQHGECCTRPRWVWDHPRYQEWLVNAKAFLAEHDVEPLPPTLEDLDAGDVTAKGGT